MRLRLTRKAGVALLAPLPAACSEEAPCELHESWVRTKACLRGRFAAIALCDGPDPPPAVTSHPATQTWEEQR